VLYQMQGLNVQNTVQMMAQTLNSELRYNAAASPLWHPHCVGTSNGID
jgi:hypothetical protein